MESKIRVLNEQTINQIAAGEVIENAASVIKELVENSLDAGATDISVEISGGGRQLIRVRDNGCGMNADDALLCLERHATSKIKAVDDLHTISSMGFRGEALPSIASISKFTLITGTGDQGTIVLVEGGKILKCAPVACEKGTMIEVKDLFFNVPARKKFQKSPAHDVQEILKSLSILALGHPGIKFELISNQKTLLKTQNEERISDVLGVDFKQELSPIEAEKDEWRLEGYIGLPACTRPNRTGQYLFINKRAVVSPLVSYAVREGYGPALAPNRHPIFVLYLTLPGSQVDVNVHPQKREVRMRHEQALREWLVRAVEGALSKRYADPIPYSVPVELPLEPIRPFMAYPEKHAEPMYVAEERPKPMVTPSLFKSAPVKPKLYVVATFPGYIIAESPLQQGLSLIDQRAAHARIIFEKLVQEDIAVQNLLIPYTLELTPVECEMLRCNVEGLNQIGIGIKEFGHNAYCLDAIPQIFGNSDLQTFVRELLTEMQQPEMEKRKQVAQAASRAATSRNRRLVIEEAQTLVNQLTECENGHQCPQGKPTMAQIPFTDLTKYFQKL